MNQTRLLKKLEGFRNRNTTTPAYVNKDVYRLLYDEEIYIIAYNAIKSNYGAETEGSDGSSLIGFCMDWVYEIISKLKDESYLPLPNRTQLIPKKNGKMRKLGFPNGKDKILQEVIRIVLENIYDPTFSDFSHGFRPHRSTQTVMGQIDNWQGTTWFIEGDISACFDEIDHRILETILRERISDERFIRLLNKMLRAGYFDMQHQYISTKTGTPQGSTCSPILANIYLDKLDRFMTRKSTSESYGKGRRKCSNYTRIQYQIEKCTGLDRSEENRRKILELVKMRKLSPSVNMFDPKFKRVRYVRYADDFLIGITAPMEYANTLREEIRCFLSNELHLRLNMEKTKITHAGNEYAHFLGYLINRGTKASRRKGNIRIHADIDSMLRTLHKNGLCDDSGYPTGMSHFIPMPPEKIINYANQVLRGLINQAMGCCNLYSCDRIQYIVQYSAAKTLARKYDISMKKVFDKLGSQLHVNYKSSSGKAQKIQLALYPNFKRKPRHFYELLNASKIPFAPRYNSQNPTKKPCTLCGSIEHIQMFHRKTISRLKSPYSEIVDYMVRINRRQIPVCSNCYKSLCTS